MRGSPALATLFSHKQWICDTPVVPFPFVTDLSDHPCARTVQSTSVTTISCNVAYFRISCDPNFGTFLRTRATKIPRLVRGMHPSQISQGNGKWFRLHKSRMQILLRFIESLDAPTLSLRNFYEPLVDSMTGAFSTTPMWSMQQHAAMLHMTERKSLCIFVFAFS